MYVDHDVIKRRNVFSSTGEDYALLVRFSNNKIDYSDSWCLTSWEKQPTKEQVEYAMKIFIRSCDVYHRQLKFPTFSLTTLRKNEQ